MRMTTSQRHDVGVERRRGDRQAFHRAEHRDGGRDDAVAIEHGGTHQRQQQPQPAPTQLAHTRRRAAREVVHQQGQQREDAAFALVVGPHQHPDVLEADHDDQRPQEQRRAAEHVLGAGRHASLGVEGLLQRVQRAGAQVAEDDAQRGAAPGRWWLGRRRRGVPPGWARGEIGRGCSWARAAHQWRTTDANHAPWCLEYQASLCGCAQASGRLSTMRGNSEPRFVGLARDVEAVGQVEVGTVRWLGRHADLQHGVVVGGGPLDGHIEQRLTAAAVLVFGVGVQPLQRGDVAAPAAVATGPGCRAAAASWNPPCACWQSRRS